MTENTDLCNRIAKNWDWYKTPKENAVVSEYLVATCCDAKDVVDSLDWQVILEYEDPLDQERCSVLLKTSE